MGNQDAEVLNLFARGLKNRHGIRRSRRLEAHREKDHLLVGMRPRQLQSVQWGINNPHVGAQSLGVKKTLRRARHPQHVAKGTEEHVRLSRNGDGAINHFQRSDTNGTAGAVDKRHLLGQ